MRRTTRQTLLLLGAASLVLAACGGSSESGLDSISEEEAAAWEEAGEVDAPAPAPADDDMQQVVEVDDQLVLSDFNPRCIIERVSQAGSVWFTVELTNELEKDYRFEISVNAFFDGEFKGNRTFNSREIEAGRRGRDESFIQNVDEGDKRRWTCQVASLTAN